KILFGKVARHEFDARAKTLDRLRLDERLPARSLCCFKQNLFNLCAVRAARATLREHELIIKQPAHSFDALGLSVPMRIGCFDDALRKQLEQPLRLNRARQTHPFPQPAPARAAYV